MTLHRFQLEEEFRRCGGAAKFFRLALSLKGREREFLIALLNSIPSLRDRMEFIRNVRSEFKIT